MELSSNIHFTVKLTPREFTLVTSALRGELRDEEADDAIELQQNLVKQRLRSSRQLLNQLNRLEQNVKGDFNENGNR